MHLRAPLRHGITAVAALEYSRAVVKWLEFVSGLVIVIVLGIATTMLVLGRSRKGTS